MEKAIACIGDAIEDYRRVLLKSAHCLDKLIAAHLAERGPSLAALHISLQKLDLEDTAHEYFRALYVVWQHHVVLGIRSKCDDISEDFIPMIRWVKEKPALGSIYGDYLDSMHDLSVREAKMLPSQDLQGDLQSNQKSHEQLKECIEKLPEQELPSRVRLYRQKPAKELEFMILKANRLCYGMPVYIDAVLGSSDEELARSSSAWETCHLVTSLDRLCRAFIINVFMSTFHVLRRPV